MESQLNPLRSIELRFLAWCRDRRGCRHFSSVLIRRSIWTGEICCLALAFLLGAAYIEVGKTAQLELAFKISSAGLLLEVVWHYGEKLFPFFGKGVLHSHIPNRLERRALVTTFVLEFGDELVFVID